MIDLMKQAIKEVVESKQGCKATELVVFVAEAHPELIILLDSFTDALEEMVHAGELVEVEYALPTMSYRIKSFLLPKGTQVVVKDGRMR